MRPTLTALRRGLRRHRGRRIAVLIAVTFAAWSAPSMALAHGLATREDLPLPFWLVTYGAGGVLVLTFVALGVLWTRPRFERGIVGVAAPDPLNRVAGGLEWLLRVVGILAFAVVWLVAIVGPDTIPQNLAPWAVFIWLWVGGLMISGLVGDLWNVLSPFETGVRATDAMAGKVEVWRTPIYERVGVWPAAAMLFGFVWLELVYPTPSQPRELAVFIGIYVGVLAVGALWTDRTWIKAAEPFGVLFRIISAMAPFHRDDEGRLRLRPPLTGLADLEIVPGTAAVILIALGSTSFDGATGLELYSGLVEGRPQWQAMLINTVGLVTGIAVVAGLYVWSMSEAAERTGRSTRELVDRFVHSLVPIALAYAIGHYFSFIVLDGQRLLILASDPLQRGWNLFGTAAWEVNYRLLSTSVIAYIQAGSIVAGHLAGVLLAHDRAVAMFEGRQATRSQLALLVAMVAYTIGGLLLLLG